MGPLKKKKKKRKIVPELNMKPLKHPHQNKSLKKKGKIEIESFGKP
jgi:hypothetical protein